MKTMYICEESFKNTNTSKKESSTLKRRALQCSEKALD